MNQLKKQGLMGNELGQQPQDYKDWLKSLKVRVRQVQLKAAVAVNQELLQFYWELGADIVEKQKGSNWGSGFLKQLSQDLMAEFPEVRGFSYRNLLTIKQWYLFYREELTNCATACGAIEPQVAAQVLQIPWGHNRAIVSKCENTEEALFYVQKTLAHSWSRAVLVHQIESGLYHREGKAITNFSKTLPAPQSDLAQQLIKDPYKFDFLALTDDYTERELERGLIGHITKFLLELGAGFAYIGKQRPATQKRSRRTEYRHFAL